MKIRESHLQNGILNYNKRFLDYKRDSRLAIYPPEIRFLPSGGEFLYPASSPTYAA